MERELRLRSSRELSGVVGTGRSVARPEFVLYHSSRVGRDHPRFGFSVSRRIGTAVARNRVKRLLREACRALAPRMEPADVVIVARAPVLGLSLSDLQRALEESAARAGLIRISREGTST